MNRKMAKLRFPYRITVSFTTDQGEWLETLMRNNECASIAQVLRLIVNDTRSRVQGEEYRKSLEAKQSRRDKK